MIDELHIRGLGVIEDATLQLSSGLTVATGETGAGKTMLVTALQLLTGGRADSGLVRDGAPAAVVEARLVPAPAAAGDWATDDDELVVSREIPPGGRSRTRINGRMAPASALAEILGAVVEVHAQHDHVRLARPDTQRRLLDRYAGAPHARALEEYRGAYDDWRRTRSRLRQLDAEARERARVVDRLRYEIAEIEAADLDVDTDSRLAAELDLLEHAEELRLAAMQAVVALSEEGAGEPLGVAVEALRRVDVDHAQLDDLRERLLTFADGVRDLAADLRNFAETVTSDPHRLEELRTRQALLAQLCRKYGAGVGDIVDYAEQARDELARLEQDSDDAGSLATLAEERRRTVERLAEDVSRGRRTGAERLEAAVADHLRDLAMPHARFRVAVDPEDEPGGWGRDRVTFLLAPNPGDAERPLARAASGGERSRVSLALEAALADADDAEVLVFDEVDAGIGGETAMAVGAKLAQLARAGGTEGGGRQVLCVTHLPQLAAFADVHHVVEKGVRGGRAVTTTREISQHEREAELSRMLGGDPSRAVGREHARELLAEALEARAG